jgi:acyl carrier protein
VEPDIESEIRNALEEKFHCTREMISLGSRLRQDLGLDNFAMADLAEELEERLRIPVEFSEFCPLQTVGEVLVYLEKAKS